MTSKTILMTGCSAGGIGAATAFALAKRQSYHVIATARQTHKIPDSLTSLSNVTVLALDITSPESVRAAVEAVNAASGRNLDVLFNNAGAGDAMPVPDIDVEKAKEIYEVNV